MSAPELSRENLGDLLEFLRGITFTIGVLPIVYGTLTMIFGDDLWPVQVYHTAQEVPGAPQSWGTIAFIAGVAIVVGQQKWACKWILFGCIVMTLWTMFFAVAFITDGVTKHQVSGFAPAVVYLCLSAVFATRSVLAHKWRSIR